MKRIATTCLFVFLLAGCVSTSKVVTPELAGDIPEGANLIKVYSEQPRDELYRETYQSLASRGYAIAESNEEMGTLSTEFSEIGQQTLLKVRAFVQEQNDGSGSVAQLRGRWGAGQNLTMFVSMYAGANASQMQGQPAEWKQRNRAGVAFGALATLANELPHERIEYEKE